MDNNKTINIEGIEYLYSITKMENKNGISINLYENKEPKIISFKYEALLNKIVQDIKPLFLCESIDEMIISLKDILNKGTIKVEKREEKYFMIIDFFVVGKQSKYEIELKKEDLNNDNNNNELKIKLKELDDKFKEIKDEINVLKKQNSIVLNKEDKKKIIKEIKEDLNINECIKEVLKDKEIKDILFKEFEERLSNVFIKNEKEEKNNEKLLIQKIDKSVNEIINEKCKTKIDEKDYNERLNKIQNEINNQIKEINDMKENIIKNKSKENYITLKVEINEEDIGKDITLIHQCSTYKLFKNFELEDIEVEINNEKIPIKFKNNIFDKRFCEFKGEINENSAKIYNELINNYSFYWNFDKKGIYDIKIAFSKPLISCEGMFYICNNIIEIDMSKFDCSKILSCGYMFYTCENLEKINFGNLDFPLVNNFTSMFSWCYNLTYLDLTNFNTKNSKSFCSMFNECNNLEKVDVSKFNSSKCETISSMFYDCRKITEIDMFNWDMSNLKYENIRKKNPINNLFRNCEGLKKIKISGNIKKEAMKDFNGCIFDNLPKNGELILNKNYECNIPLEKYLPSGWSIKKE